MCLGNVANARTGISTVAIATVLLHYYTTIPYNSSATKAKSIYNSKRAGSTVLIVHKCRARANPFHYSRIVLPISTMAAKLRQGVEALSAFMPIHMRLTPMVMAAQSL